LVFFGKKSLKKNIQKYSKHNNLKKNMCTFQNIIGAFFMFLYENIWESINPVLPGGNGSTQVSWKGLGKT